MYRYDVIPVMVILMLSSISMIGFIYHIPQMRSAEELGAKFMIKWDIDTDYFYYVDPGNKILKDMKNAIAIWQLPPKRYRYYNRTPRKVFFWNDMFIVDWRYNRTRIIN